MPGARNGGEKPAEEVDAPPADVKPIHKVDSLADLSPMPSRIEDPILAYYAESEVNQVQWSKTQPDWVAICFDKKLQILRV